MDYVSIQTFNAGIAQDPVAETDLTNAAQAFETLSAALSAAGDTGDTIAPGTATGSQLIQDLSTYISDEETLLGRLESMAAANISGAAAWATTEISWLQKTIIGELGLLYEKGGTFSGLSEVSALIEDTTISATGHGTLTDPSGVSISRSYSRYVISPSR